MENKCVVKEKKITCLKKNKEKWPSKIITICRNLQTKWETFRSQTFSSQCCFAGGLENRIVTSYFIWFPVSVMWCTATEQLIKKKKDLVPWIEIFINSFDQSSGVLNYERRWRGALVSHISARISAIQLIDCPFLSCQDILQILISVAVTSSRFISRTTVDNLDLFLTFS